MEKYFCKAPLIQQRGFFSDAVLSTSEQLPDMTSRMQLHADVTTNHIFKETLKTKQSRWTCCCTLPALDTIAHRLRSDLHHAMIGTPV
jgi:hypothetical protein